MQSCQEVGICSYNMVLKNFGRKICMQKVPGLIDHRHSRSPKAMSDSRKGAPVIREGIKKMNHEARDPAVPTGSWAVSVS